MPPLLLGHPAALAHQVPMGHPERPDRIRAVERALEDECFSGLIRGQALRAEPEMITLIHPEPYIQAIIAAAPREGFVQIDADTSMSPGTLEAALRAVGAAAQAVDEVMAGKVRNAFSAMRPPGHHAERATAMGFCFFDNVAVAARHAQQAHGLDRVLILDWDVHHGNGTNDIFHADPSVVFVSIHEWPLYPGTGPASDVGSGAGEGATVNLPVPGGSGDDVFLSLVRDVVVPLARAVQPGLLLVSAGYDAHADDPLAGCRVSDEGYAAMAGLMRSLADELGVPLGIVLEGGYALGALARSVVTTLEAAGDGGGAGDPGGAPHPLAVDALDRLARYWPALA